MHLIKICFLFQFPQGPTILFAVFNVLLLLIYTTNSHAQPPRAEFLFDTSSSGKLTSLFRHTGLKAQNLTQEELLAIQEIETWYFDGAERLAALSRSGLLNSQQLFEEQQAYEANLRAKATEAEAELINVIGIDRFDDAVRRLNRDFLDQKLNSQGEATAHTYLTSNILVERLQLEPDQIGKLEEIRNRRQQEQDSLKRELVVSMRDLQLEKLEHFMSVLAAEQKADYLATIGEPIDWFRIEDSLGGVTAIVSAVKQRSTVRRAKSEADRQAARERYTKEGISDLPEQFDNILWLMLTSDLVRSECELTAPQQEQLRRLVVAIRDSCVISSDGAEERKRRLLNGDATSEHAPAIESILLPVQLDWLRRAELQLRLSSHADTLGLADPDTEREFQITAAQASAIRDISRQFIEREQQANDAAKQKLCRGQLKAVQDALEVLTDRQRELYLTLIGD